MIKTWSARLKHGFGRGTSNGNPPVAGFDGEPLVLQRQDTDSGYSDTFESTKFSGWPAGLAGSVSGEPVGGELGVIVATTTDLWFTTDGDVWTSQVIGDVFGSGGDMIGAAVSNVTVLVAFSPRGGGPIELWLGEPTE